MLETSKTVEPVKLLAVLEAFPLATPRPVQERVAAHFDRVVQDGYRDVVIAAPTGAGKSGILLALCQWAAFMPADQAKSLGLSGTPGGYYLTAQKLLQDQIERDIPRYRRPYHGVGSLKSSVSYACPTHVTCNVGLAADGEHKCKLESCAYKLAKCAFLGSPAALTNYAYFFTERYYVGRFPRRRVLAIDECHAIETAVLGFVDVKVSEGWLAKYAPLVADDGLPKTEELDEMTAWLADVYLPAAHQHFENLLSLAGDSDRLEEELAKDIFALENNLQKTERALKSINQTPDDWVYWQEENTSGEREAIVRPLDVAPFVKELVTDAADIRVYASAYPGSKEVYCRSLGLKSKDVAWMNLASDFDPARRPIVMCTVGPMGRQNQERTLPGLLKLCVRLAKKHARERGLVHCFSYRLSEAVYDALEAEFPGRCLFPRNAQEREAAFDAHVSGSEPTILISPSMAEGFDFKDDLARWQILAKCPYKSLSDRRTKALLDRDPEWYQCEALKSFIQACGRVCRNKGDHGVTYVLDADVTRLLERVDYTVPKWFKNAIVYLD